MSSTCGVEDCDSSCHRPEVNAGRYCAPARCYCGGCPAHVPVERGPGAAVDRAHREALQIHLANRLDTVDAVPMAEAPAELQTVRAQLAELAELQLGPARHRAARARAARTA